MKIKKGDTVVILAGRDKNRQGKVIAAYPRLDKVLVEGVNVVKRHTRVRQTQRGSKTGGIITTEAPIDVSNVSIVDEHGNPTRVGYRYDEEGQKIRVARSTGKDL